MNLKYYLLLLFAFAATAFFAGQQEGLVYPDYFPKPSYDFSKNNLTPAKIALGRALFYDPILSQDSSISCASCHSPYNAFAHTDHDLSHGIRDQIGTRNAPALFNLAWQNQFMWDGAINHLDMQALAPISDTTEMGESIANVVQKLQRKALYPPLFYAAFQDSLISGTRVLKALSQFQLSLVSATAKYDQVQAGTADFTDQEKNGYALFQKHCNSCHTEPLFSNYTFANNGLPVDTSLQDMGRWTITQESRDSLLFKIPSLRNLSFTYPYMHDGRFRKLRQVIQHYTQGIVSGKTIGEALSEPLAIGERDQVDLLAFLLTLDDKSFVFDAKHQFPRKVLLGK